MALSSQSVHSSNPEKTELKQEHKIDIQGVERTSCSNCTECPQFVSIPGHVLCAYCGCPPARHTKAATGSEQAGESGQRKRGREADRLTDSEDWDSDEDEEEVGSDDSSQETSSGVSSFGSGGGGRAARRTRRHRPWRPALQVTAPPPRVARLLDGPCAVREVQLEHGWNEADTSTNIYLKQDDPLTFHRNPVYQTTDAIRGKGGESEEGYSSGLHVWTVVWPAASRGTHPVVGVATRDCHLSEPGYKRLVGSNATSWGWCLKTMKVYHDSRKFRAGVQFPRDIDEKLRVPDKFYMILDMDRGTLAFQVNNDFLGVAFSGLRGEELYPMVSAVWGHCEVTLAYHGSHHFDRERSAA